MTRAGCFVTTGLVLMAPASPPAAQSATPSSIFRVFLRAGDALPSYGQAALVGDRVIFTLLVGGDESKRRRYQLVDLPAREVDVDRTAAYADAVRGAHYAATRGESEFAGMTADVSRTLDVLPGIADPGLRLTVAERARERMAEWAGRSYGYRAGDLAVLEKMFDVVLAELRTAAGRTRIAVELSSRPVPGEREPLRPAPDTAESVRTALAAAAAADEGVERVAILAVAEDVVAGSPELAGLRREVETRLRAERTADRAYADLSGRLLREADAALAAGDPAAVEVLASDLEVRDRQLGGLRPRLARDLARQLELKLVAARAQRAALDHYARVRPLLLDYEHRIRPVLVTLDGLRPVVLAVRDMRYTSFDRLRAAQARIETAASLLDDGAPPDDLADVHATLTSAVHLCREALARRLQAATSGAAATARDASSAAAGALLLLSQARDDLVARLFPPKPR